MVIDKEALEKRLTELRKELEQLQNNGNALQRELEQLQNNGNAILGAIMDCEYWLAQLENEDNENE